MVLFDLRFRNKSSVKIIVRKYSFLTWIGNQSNRNILWDERSSRSLPFTSLADKLSQKFSSLRNGLWVAITVYTSVRLFSNEKPPKDAVIEWLASLRRNKSFGIVKCTLSGLRLLIFVRLKGSVLMEYLIFLFIFLVYANIQTFIHLYFFLAALITE